MMPWKTKKVPQTTNNLTTAIVNFLLSKKHSASRINVQGQWDEDQQVWRKSGSRNGFFDIAACIDGAFVAIDIKKGDDVMSKDQIKFQKEVIAAKGVAITIENYNEFLIWYQNYTHTE